MTTIQACQVAAGGYCLLAGVFVYPWIAPFVSQMSMPTFSEMSSEQIRLKACCPHLHCYSLYKSKLIMHDLIVIIVHSICVWKMFFRVSRIVVL